MNFIQMSFERFLQSGEPIAVVLDGGAIEAQLEEMLQGQISKLRATEALSSEKGWLEILHPFGLKTSALWIAVAGDAKELGAKLAAKTKGEVLVWGQSCEFAYGFELRNYAFEKYKTKEPKTTSLTICGVDMGAEKSTWKNYQALVEGVHLTRDLVHEPTNVLGTIEFADRISALSKLGVEIEILDEPELEKIGMRALLGVGQGSEMPSKVAIMHWKGAKTAPLLLVGKGVVFDTGGISIKPAAGMEEMTMDMGGAATVVGTMHAIAKRKADAHVIGIVGLVENMPDGKAQRPGDIVKSLKGDTIEVINTDAEGRLVLADIIWYAQERFKPAAVIDLATLTGAIMIALGFEKAGVFGNDDAFTKKFIDAANEEGEGAWHMPLGAAYDKLIDGKLADVANVGGRYGGSITAAQFIKRFVKDDMPWIHLDIAGVALRKTDDIYAPHGASGWGVRALNRLIQNHFET